MAVIVLSEHPSQRTEAITFRGPRMRPGERNVRRDPASATEPWKAAFTRLDEVDPMVAARAAQDGHTPDDVVRMRITVYLGLLTKGRLRGALMVTVRRDRGGKTFTAQSRVPGPWGHGETIGEALADFVDDLLRRSDVLIAERDHLGPALEREAKALERLIASAD